MMMETCCHSDSSEKPSAKTDVKNSKGVNNNNYSSVLGAVTEGLVQGLESLEITGRVEIIQTTALLRSARILRRVLETRGDLLSLKL